MTVVEVVDRVMPVEDGEISAFAHKAFEKQGIKIMTGPRLTGSRKPPTAFTATIDKGGKTQEIDVDKVLFAVGIVGNIEDIGLEAPR